MTSSTTDVTRSELASGLLDAMNGAVAPIRESITKSEARVGELESELAELRQMIRNAHRVLALIDPEHEPPAKPGPKAKSKPRGTVGNRSMHGKLGEWLREHVTPDDDLSPPTLSRRDDFDVMDRSSIGGNLARLADEGVVRLDRIESMGPSGTGKPSKVYRLVPTVE